MFVVPCICTQCVFHGNKSNFNAGIYVILLNTNIGLSQISPQKMYQFDCVIFMINSSKSHLILPPSLIYPFIPLIYHLFIFIYKISICCNLFSFALLYQLTFVYIYVTYFYYITCFHLLSFILFTLLYFCLLYLFHLFVNSIVNLLVATTIFTDFYQVIYCRHSNPEQTGRKSVWCEMLNFGLLSVENTWKQTQFQSIQKSLNQ